MDPLHDEETQLVTTLSSLEGSTSRHIAELFSSSLEDRAAFNARSTRIREDLAALRAAMRDLAILAEEQDTEQASARLADMLKGHQAEYEKLQTAFKQANVQVRRNTEAAAAEARKAMLAGGQAHSAPARAAGQADAVAASQGITKSLLRSRQLMAQELEHTSATLAAMDASNERLAEGREELRGQRGLFSGSRKLLRALFRSSVLDTLSLYGGLAIFFLVVAYILQKRTLYFAPIGKVMAPVAGTAWNASRSAAHRAGQLPSAVLALHRRLNAKGRGAPLLVDEELPASVDRVLQDDSTDDSHLEEAWKQQTTPPDEQQGADAGSGSTSDDATQHPSEAEPDSLADVPAPPEDAATAHQPAEEQPTVSTDPAVQLPPDADEPTSLPDAAVIQSAPDDMPNEERPTAAADDATAPAANGSNAHRQPATADNPGEPADAGAGVLLPADTATKEAPTGPTGEPSVPQLSDKLSKPAATGAAEEPAAAATDPAPAAAGDMMSKPDGAGDMGAASGGGVSNGALDLQLEATDADGQPDTKGPDGSPAGGRAATDGVATAEPVAEPPSADGAEEAGSAEASGSEQAVPPESATAEETNLDLPADESDQPPVPPKDSPVDIQASREGLTAAAAPPDGEGTSLAAEPDGSAAQPGDTHEDILGDRTAPALQHELQKPEVSAPAGAGAPGPESAEEAGNEDIGTMATGKPQQADPTAAAADEADGKQEPPLPAAVGQADLPPEDTQQAPPVQPDNTATPAQPGAGGMRPADEEHKPAEGTPAAAAIPAPAEENVIYDEQGNKFEWRWHPEAGTAGQWKLYVAGTDTLVHGQQDDEAIAAEGTVPSGVVPGGTPEEAVTAQTQVQEPAPAAELVHEEL